MISNVANDFAAQKTPSPFITSAHLFKQLGDSPCFQFCGGGERERKKGSICFSFGTICISSQRYRERKTQTHEFTVEILSERECDLEKVMGCSKAKTKLHSKHENPNWMELSHHCYLHCTMTINVLIDQKR